MQYIIEINLVLDSFINSIHHNTRNDSSFKIINKINLFIKILIYMIDEIIISDNTNKYRFKLKSFIIVLTGK